MAIFIQRDNFSINHTGRRHTLLQNGNGHLFSWCTFLTPGGSTAPNLPRSCHPQIGSIHVFYSTPREDTVYKLSSPCYHSMSWYRNTNYLQELPDGIVNTGTVCILSESIEKLEEGFLLICYRRAALANEKACPSHMTKEWLFHHGGQWLINCSQHDLFELIYRWFSKWSHTNKVRMVTY